MGLNYQIYDPYSIAPSSTPGGRFTRQPLTGNLIPANRINPTAKKLMEFYPDPNLPGAVDGRNNWTTPGPEWMNYYTHITRVDHNFSDKHRLFARAKMSARCTSSTTTRFKDNAEGGYLTRKNSRTGGRRSVYVFSPSLLVEHAVQLYPACWSCYPPQVSSDIDKASLGFSSGFLSNLSKIAVPADLSLPMPYINMSDIVSLSTTGASKEPRWDVHSLASSLTHIVRCHSLRYGAEFRTYRREHVRDRATRRASSTSAPIGLAGRWTTRRHLPSARAWPASSTGFRTREALRSARIPTPSRRNTAWGLFLNDDWKVTSRLTA